MLRVYGVLLLSITLKVQSDKTDSFRRQHTPTKTSIPSPVRENHITLPFVSSDETCGNLSDKNKVPWSVGVYLEKGKDHLELICLGTVLNENHVLTAAQCVCESLSNLVRKEHIFVSNDIQKEMRQSSNVVRVQMKDVISRSDYQGFLLNPVADLAVLKLGDSIKFTSSVCVDWTDLHTPLKEKETGIISLWDDQLKTLETSFLDYDSCTLSTSKDFGGIIGHDKNCFEVSASNLVPESIGSGIYFQNPKDGKWYLEGIISGKETTKNKVIVAATSLKIYLSWLSRVCYD